MNSRGGRKNEAKKEIGAISRQEKKNEAGITRLTAMGGASLGGRKGGSTPYKKTPVSAQQTSRLSRKGRGREEKGLSQLGEKGRNPRFFPNLGVSGVTLTSKRKGGGRNKESPSASTRKKSCTPVHSPCSSRNRKKESSAAQGNRPKGGEGRKRVSYSIITKETLLD